MTTPLARGRENYVFKYISKLTTKIEKGAGLLGVIYNVSPNKGIAMIPALTSVLLYYTPVQYLHTSVHKGRPAREFLDANGVESMPWPANSPDLNLIENVWSMIKYYIQERYPEFERMRQRNRAEIRPIVLEAWYHSTTEEKLTQLIGSMARRYEEVLNANGGPISYYGGTAHNDSNSASKGDSHLTLSGNILYNDILALSALLPKGVK
ncbi:hypothetical protein K3495_g15208, partial [Podosphaera aphanis]